MFHFSKVPTFALLFSSFLWGAATAQDTGMGEVRFVNVSIGFIVSSNLFLNSTDEDRQLFLETFVPSYNNADEILLNDTDTCIVDAFNRTLFEGFIQDFDISGEIFVPDIVVEIAKQAGNDTSSPPDNDNDFYDLLTYFTGTCVDCPDNLPFFAQDTLNRMLLQNFIRKANRKLQVDDCEDRAPTTDEVLFIFQEELAEVLPDIIVADLFEIRAPEEAEDEPERDRRSRSYDNDVADIDTPSPTESPTESPTDAPTEAPTDTPTDVPTYKPTPYPTPKPSIKPEKPSPKPYYPTHPSPNYPAEEPHEMNVAPGLKPLFP